MTKISDLNTLKEQGESYDFSYADGQEPESIEEQSYLGGKKRKRVRKGGLKSKIQNFKKGKAVEAEKIATQVKAISKENETPIKLPPMPKIEKDKGMSKTTKGLIIGGGLLVLGILGFIVYKKMGHKK